MEVLDRATTVFFSLVGADTNKDREKLQGEYSTKFAAHSDAISLNPKLFARIKALYDSRATLGLDPQSVRLIERYHTSFVRSGANLSDADKATLKQMNAELAALGTKFSQNVLAEVNASALVVEDVKELDGLSEQQMQTDYAQYRARHLQASN